MKIGIVTVEKSANVGSFLQAYALQKVLEAWGHEVYFVSAGKQHDYNIGSYSFCTMDLIF